MIGLPPLSLRVRESLTGFEKLLMIIVLCLCCFVFSLVFSYFLFEQTMMTFQKAAERFFTRTECLRSLEKIIALTVQSLSERQIPLFSLFIFFLFISSFFGL